MLSQSTFFNRVLPISWRTCGPTWCDTCQLVELHTITMKSTFISASDTVEQRDRIASAIAIPNNIYLARHCCHFPAMITRLQSLILDFVWGVRDGKRSRSWVPSEMASLPIQQGGLSVPCTWTELMTMVATASYRIFASFNDR